MLKRNGVIDILRLLMNDVTVRLGKEGTARVSVRLCNDDRYFVVTELCYSFHFVMLFFFLYMI